MRNLALSALIVLAREPEALLGPSFQMSYAAVAALIAAAEWARGRFPPAEPGGPLHRLLRWALVAVVALLATTVVATLATAPFGSFHFHALNPFGVIGNALAVPLVSVVVMPCAVLGVLAFPFGLDRPVWELMGLGVAEVVRVSQWVSDFGGSTVVVPAFAAEALGLIALALIVLTVLVSPLRLAAIVPAAAGLWMAATPKRFDIIIDRAGAGAAVRSASGALVTVGRVCRSSSSNGCGPTATRASPTTQRSGQARAATPSAASSALPTAAPSRSSRTAAPSTRIAGGQPSSSRRSRRRRPASRRSCSTVPSLPRMGPRRFASPRQGTRPSPRAARTSRARGCSAPNRAAALLARVTLHRGKTRARALLRRMANRPSRAFISSGGRG